MSMLNMFNYTFFKDTTSNRKLFFKSKILYIDDSFLFKDSKRSENISKITEICKESGFPFDIIMLENVLKINFSKLLQGDIQEQDLTKENPELIRELELLISSFPSKILMKLDNSSFIEDFLSILKRNLIFFYALKNSFTKVD